MVIHNHSIRSILSCRILPTMVTTVITSGHHQASQLAVWKACREPSTMEGLVGDFQERPLRSVHHRLGATAEIPRKTVWECLFNLTSHIGPYVLDSVHLTPIGC